MRTVVIGAGLAGLTASIRLLEAGVDVTLVSKGPGGLALSQGSIDVLGYRPSRVTRPLEVLGALPGDHPYAVLGTATVRESVSWLGQRLGLVGSPATNLQLPTAAGAIRPTALAWASLAAGDVRDHTTFAVIGVQQVKDFPAALIAGNLDRTVFDGRELRAGFGLVDFEARDGEQDPSPVHFARALDDAATRRRFASAVAAAAGTADVVLVPGIVGLDDPGAWDDFVAALGRPAAEVAMQPPSIPGLRMFQRLLDDARALGLRHVQGSLATGFTHEDGRITGIEVASAGHSKHIRCDAVVHAPGGFESGGLGVDSHGVITERLFGLPLTVDSLAGLTEPEVGAPQPLFEVGVLVDADMRPLGLDGPVHTNLHVAGGILAGAQRAREKSGDGIAVASAWRAAESILGGAR